MRDQLVEVGRMLYGRGLSPGTSGNLSVRTDDGFLMTPTNASLGALDAARISELDADGEHAGGDPPTKEVWLHLAMYAERPEAKAIVHLHSTYSVAVACLDAVDEDDVLPPLTPYYVLRVGRLPLVPYGRPGDESLAGAVRARAKTAHALLLANHGPIVAAPSLAAAAAAAEEIEETAKLVLLTHGLPTRVLTDEQVRALRGE
jgi:ribulose-5-phosphate 4-epimerase/fuculose-1-phosphate aldolase